MQKIPITAISIVDLSFLDKNLVKKPINTGFCSN